MKNIIICCSPFGNPVSDYFKYLGLSFKELNYKVVFVFDGKKVIADDSYNNFEYYSWPSKRPTKLKDFFFFNKIIKKYKPQICISNFGSTNVVGIVSFFNKVRFRLNYVHTTQIQIRHDAKYSIFKTNLLRLRKNLIYTLYSHLLTNSNGTKEDILKHFLFKESSISVFPLLILKSNESSSNSKRLPNVIIIGRLHQSKGHKNLIEQFKYCLDNGLNLKLLIAGSGCLELNLNEYTSHLKCENQIVFLGNISRCEVSKYLSRSLIHVSSSISEAFGLVNIEALREGTPIISTNTEGAKDILIPGYNGELFFHNKKDSLFISMNKILNNYNHYSINALKSFDDNFDLEKNIYRQRDELINFLKI